MAERVGVGDCNVGKGQVQVSKDGDSGLVVLRSCVPRGSGPCIVGV